MTIREWCEDYCYQRGMFRDQAKAVVDRFAADPRGETMRGRWDDDVTGYPKGFAIVMGIAVSSMAVAWIDENLPRAWYRPMFAGEPPAPPAELHEPMEHGAD